MSNTNKKLHSASSPKEASLENTDINTDTPYLFNILKLKVCSLDFWQKLNVSYDNLEFDYYDVRREQIELLYENHYIKSIFSLRDYYLNGKETSELFSLFPDIPIEIKNQLELIRPYRKKAVSEFIIKNDKQNLIIEKKQIKQVAQNTVETDIRSLPRKYAEIKTNIVSDEEFSKLIHFIAKCVISLNSSIPKMKVHVWQMSTLVYSREFASNSPEGVHQDGADYIVSALVVDRVNVGGGASRVYDQQGKHKILEHVLEPGEGLLHADQGSKFYHDVSPIFLKDKDSSYGARRILGFDVYLEK